VLFLFGAGLTLLLALALGAEGARRLAA
jgi:hypothetical protein